MPWVFGRGSRGQPAALISDQPIPASTGIWCRQEMACSGKPCRQSANLTPVPYSGALLQHLEAQPVGLDELGLQNKALQQR